MIYVQNPYTSVKQAGIAFFWLREQSCSRYCLHTDEYMKDFTATATLPQASNESCFARLPGLQNRSAGWWETSLHIFAAEQGPSKSSQHSR